MQDSSPPWRLGEDVRTERVLAYLAGELDALSERFGRPRSAVDTSQPMFFPIEVAPTHTTDHQKVFDELLSITAVLGKRRARVGGPQHKILGESR